MDDQSQAPIPSRPASPSPEVRRDPRAAAFRSPPTPAGAGSGSFISLADIYFIIFRHKWKIILLSIVGVLSAYVVKSRWPVTYTSEAKLMIRYLEEDRGPTFSTDEEGFKSPDIRGETIINSEIQIMTSRDLAESVAATVGPERILAALGPDINAVDNPRAAAGMVRGGLMAVAQEGSRVVLLTFTHPDPSVTQPVLDQVIKEYLKRHVEIHRSTGLNENYVLQETEQLRLRLSRTEEELRAIKDRAGVLSLDEIKNAYATEMAKVRQEIFATESELAERKAILEEFAATDSEKEIRTQLATDYRRVNSLLEQLYRREQDLLIQFAPEGILVKQIRAQIAQQEEVKRNLENENPWLTVQTLPMASQGRTPSQGGLTFDPAIESARIRALETRLEVLGAHSDKIRKEAAQVGALELSLTDLERKRDLELSNYLALSQNLNESRIREALGPGRVSNISIIQTPAPPRGDSGKLNKVFLLLIVGGLAAGLALAFCIELYLDPSIKRQSDIETKVNLPLILSIPVIRRLRRPRGGTLAAPLEAEVPRAANGSTYGTMEPNNQAALVPWAPNHVLQPFLTVLRDKLIHVFEVRGLIRKPKLVGVTSCGERAGVSTIASGLAASLSQTGEGNVLLVDMNPGQPTPHYFQHGELKCGVAEVLDHDKRGEARAGQNLYVASHAAGNDVSHIMPKNFGSLVPRLKASDFDYIIFDLPAVSQMSSTSQLARHMDLVLMVLESEKTHSEAARRAGDMVVDSGTDVAVILNKLRRYVPRRLLQEV